MRRLTQAIIYGLLGSVFVPFCGAILLIPALVSMLVSAALPVFASLTFAQPISIVVVPFIDYSGSNPNPPIWIIPLFGALAFATGGALMRPQDEMAFDDIRLFSLFCRKVFLWMLRGALFGTVWGAILGFAFQNIKAGLFLGAVCGEMGGLAIGAIHGSLIRGKSAR